MRIGDCFKDKERSTARITSTYVLFPILGECDPASLKYTCTAAGKAALNGVMACLLYVRRVLRCLDVGKLINGATVIGETCYTETHDNHLHADDIPWFGRSDRLTAPRIGFTVECHSEQRSDPSC